MKQCPNCLGLELYDNEERTCPHCGTILVTYIRANNRDSSSHSPGTPAEAVHPHSRASEHPSASAPAFERRSGNVIAYRGVVSGVSTTSQFMSRLVKWLHAICRGVPYQFGNPVYETIIRIENMTQERIPDQMRSLVFYGQTGEIEVGDDVTVTAVVQGGRFVIKKLFINDTESYIHAYGQIPAAAIRVLALITAALVLSFVLMVVSLFSSGRIWSLLGSLMGGALSLVSKLVVTLAPLAVLVFIYWLFFRKRG